MKNKLIRLAVLFTALLALATETRAQSTAFTYQGRLTENGAPANGSNDFTFTLYTLVSGGGTVGSSNVVNDLAVSNGNFTVTLDYGAGAFDGSERWLQIAVRSGASVGTAAYTNLLPRQHITSAPYAIRALSAGTAGTATTANGIAAGTVTSAGLASGSVDSAKIADGSIASADLNPSLLNYTFWKLGGNDVGATLGANVIGSTNKQPVEIRANNFRALRLEPSGSGGPPNVLGGYHQNTAGTQAGAAIAGGGTQGSINSVEGDYGFIGAGHGGHAGHFAAVIGGAYNSSIGQFSFVGTGERNTNLGFSAGLVAGSNNFVGPAAGHAFIGGGASNRAIGAYSTVPGGRYNQAIGVSSFAAGTHARASHDGSVVFADPSGGTSPAAPDFASTGTNQFLIRATGGVGIGTANPSTTLDVNGIVTTRELHWSTSGLLTDDQGGSMELGDSSKSFAIPYLDFHYGVSGNQDYNVRLINDADHRLSVEGDFRVSGDLTAARLSGNGAGLTSLNAGNLIGTLPAAALGNVWKIGGNSGTAGGSFGTLDNQPMTILAGNSRVLSLETKAVELGGRRSITAANVLGGANVNTIASGAIGATIGGGGSLDVDNIVTTPQPNTVLGRFGTVSGGLDNSAGSADANNGNGSAATVAGGEKNRASGMHSFVGGGLNNLAAGNRSFAAGNQAKANHGGSYVWADSQNADFSSSATNQFSVRASGGVRLSDDTPSLSFGSTVRQMINLWGTSYGIGVQSENLYFRTDGFAGAGGFAWYQGGVHDHAAGNAGGGQTLMKLDSSGLKVSNVQLDVDPNGGIEIGPTMASFAVPFIDFHHGVSSVQDFNVRLINDANHQLTLQGNLNVTANASVCSLTIRGGCDLAEPFKISGHELPKGSVVVIDEANPGHLRLSDSAYDTRVAGIVSGANGVNTGISLSQQGVMEGDQNVALSGRVYVQAEAASGPIRPGDLLTTSSTPGHAMRVAQHDKARGAILGKAMTGLAEGRGMVLVLVTLQ